MDRFVVKQDHENFMKKEMKKMDEAKKTDSSLVERNDAMVSTGVSFVVIPRRKNESQLTQSRQMKHYHARRRKSGKETRTYAISKLSKDQKQLVIDWIIEEVKRNKDLKSKVVLDFFQYNHPTIYLHLKEPTIRRWITYIYI